MNGKPASTSLLVRFFDNFLQERSIRWLLALGMLILLGSSLLLVTAQWHQATPVWKYVIFLGYTAALFGAGEWTYHRLALRRTGTVLLGLTVLLVPILFLGLSWGLAEEHALDVATGDSSPVAPSSRTAPEQEVAVLTRLLLGAVTLGFSLLASTRIFGQLLRGAQPTFLACYLILAMAGAVLPLVPDGWQSSAALLLWGVFAAGTMKVNRHVFWLAEERRKPRIFGFFPIALLGGQFLALYLLFAAPHVGLDWLGVGCVLVAAPVLAAGDALARVFQQRTGDLVRPLPWSLLAPLGVGLVLCAAGVCLAGTALVESLDRGHALVFAAGTAAGLMALVARRTKQKAFVWAMLVALTIAYRFLPSFCIDLVRALLNHGAELVREERLPLAFYGLTCLPLVAGLMAGAWHLRERSELFAGPMRRFSIGLACLLLALSLGHFKAVFPVGMVMVLVFAGQVVLFRHRLLAWPAVLAWVLAAFGLAGFLHGVYEIELPPGFQFGCLTAAAASLLIAGRWLDPWLAGHGSPAVAAQWRMPVQLCSLMLSLGLAGFWLIQVVMPPGGASCTAGALVAAMLLVQCWRWRGATDTSLALLPLVVVNWQVLALLLALLAPHRTFLLDVHAAELPALLPVVFAIAASVLLWQAFAERMAPPCGYLVQGQLWALRTLAALALAYPLALDALTLGGAAVALAAFAFVIVAETISACRDRSETRAWMAIALAGMAVAYLAWFRVLHFGSGLGMFVVLSLALLLWLGKELADRHERLTALVRPLRWTAFAMPLVTVGLGVFRHLANDHAAWLGANSLALLLAGGFYFWRGLEERRKRLVLLAAVILNVALALLWRERSWSDPQFFMIPIGITVLALVQLFKDEIAERFHDPLRYAGALMILVSPVFHIGTSWLHLFTLMLASVAIVLVAIGLRVRALMNTGAAFLVADLVAMVVRGSMDNANVLWIAGLALGTAVLGLAAACERNREALLQRMRVLAEALKQWE